MSESIISIYQIPDLHTQKLKCPFYMYVWWQDDKCIYIQIAAFQEKKRTNRSQCVNKVQSIEIERNVIQEFG